MHSMPTRHRFSTFGPFADLTRSLLIFVALLQILWFGSAEAPAAIEAPVQSIPTPESVLGFRVGADFELATYDESIEYFRRLDAASDRLQLVEVGRSSFGRPWYMAVVSAAANLAELDRYRQISLRLAHPGSLTDDEARALAGEGKAIVHIDGGLHASEVAHAQHTIQLAYDLITGDGDPEIRAILDNVILLLWPSVNPDGQNIVVEWYESNLGTPYEVSGVPWLYQKYVGHDNNRDAYMLNMVESRVLGRTWRQWEPQIVYVQHQSSPFPTRIWLPPFAEPIATEVPPLLSRTVNFIGMAIAQALEERGHPGATHMGTGFDAWYPGYVDYLPMLQNTAAFWTETALYRYATPRLYTLSDFPQSRRDLRPESLYSSPWTGGWWRLRDAVDYMLTASIATLDFAAKYKDDLQFNRYQAGRDTIRHYRREPPYAYFVPQEQRDPVAPVELLRRLAFNGVRVHQLDSAVTVDGIDYPAGTWVIAMDQEYATLARQLLDVQTYPDLREFPEGPPEQPYDASGWTLPYQMGVRVIAATQPLGDQVRGAMRALAIEAVDWADALASVPPTESRYGLATEQAMGISAGPDGRSGEPDAAPFDSVPGVGFDTSGLAAAIVPSPGRATGSGGSLAVDPAQNNAFRAINRAWRAGGTVGFEPGEIDPEGRPGRSGRLLVSGLGEPSMTELVDSLALRAERTDATGTRLEPPRVGLYRPWTASMDEGWTRWVLEQYGFEPHGLRNAEVRAGRLRERYDVIVFPDMSARQILEGSATGSVPLRFAGGIGQVGVRALVAFVQAGGTVVCLNGSSDFAIDAFGLPIENVVAETGRDEFFTSGSLLEVTTDPSHPVMSGMPERAAVFFGRSPVFTVTEGFRGAALAKYQEAGSPLLSGYLLGEEHMHGYAAAVDAFVGDGHVILIGFRPQWRGQPFGTFRVLLNAALYSSDVSGTVEANPDFWSPPPAADESDDGGVQGG